MPRQSSIKQMPPDILEKFMELLGDPRISQLEITRQINELLAERGEKPRSKSAVNRFYKNWEKVGEAVRQSREVAKIFVDEFGSQPYSDVSKSLIEIIRTITFRATVQMVEGDEPVPPKMLKELAIAVERLERAASQNLKRDEEIRQQERERLAQEFGEEAKARGMDEDEARKWREVFLGVRPPQAARV